MTEFSWTDYMVMATICLLAFLGVAFIFVLAGPLVGALVLAGYLVILFHLWWG